MYYNNNTAQHSLLREEIIEDEQNLNSLQCLIDYTAGLLPPSGEKIM